MHLRVVGAEELLYEGDVYGIKSRALDGEICCLDQHIDYLTVLNKGQVEILDKPQEPVKHRVTLKEQSILFIENNRAVIFS